jgi:hypothetical protein
LNSSANPTARAAARLAAALALAGAPAGVLTLLPATLGAQEPAAPAAAGTGRITGTVTTDAGQPIAGAQVTIPNTTLGALTGTDGRFTIPGVAPGSYQLRVQRIGYAPRTQPVSVAAGQASAVTFQVASVAAALDAVVTVGYTNQERRDISGAVSSVTDEALQARQTATVQEALRGRIPGVQIASSGEPARRRGW